MRYEYRTGEIRAALRAHGSVAAAARAMGVCHKELGRFCHEHDIPADNRIPWYLRRGFLKLKPIAGYGELPGMLKP